MNKEKQSKNQKNSISNDRKDLIDLLLDCRTSLIWLRILEKPEFKHDITKVIVRIDYYIDECKKDAYN